MENGKWKNDATVVTTVTATLEALRSLNQMVEGTNFPRLDETAIEEMIYRDSLSLLGLEPPRVG